MKPCTIEGCPNHDPDDEDGCNCSSYLNLEKDCGHYRKNQLKNEYHEKENNTMSKFEVDENATKQAQVKGNALNAMETAKNVIVQMQQGQAVIAAVRGAIKKAPGVPDGLKELMDSPYGSLITGLILHTTAPILTGNEHIQKAVKAANIAGAVELSNQFTFIQDAIETAISSIPGFNAIVDKGADYLGKREEPYDPNTDEMRCSNCNKSVPIPEMDDDGNCGTCSSAFAAQA